MTDDLVQFLRDRHDEDEQAARAAADEVGEAAWVGADGSGHAWRYRHQGVWGENDGLASDAPLVADTRIRAVQDHIARHDPARVLREVEAKRRMLDLHQPGTQEYVDGDVCMACTLTGDGPYYPCTTLRLLALPYSDHPDFLPEWRP